MPDFYVPSGEWILREGALGNEIEEMRLQVINLHDEHREAAGESTATTSNLTAERRRALREIHDQAKDVSDPSTIVYVQGDKESLYCAMRRDQLQASINKELSNPAYTKLTPEEARKQLTLMARELRKHVKLGDEENHCSPGEVRFISNTFPVEDGKARPARLKITAKTHKRINPSSNTPVPLRIILDNTNVAARGAQEYIARMADQGMREAPSYVQDTAEAVSKIEALRPSPGCIIATADVKDFYPSCPREEALQAAYKTWMRHGPAKAKWLKDLTRIASAGAVFENDRGEPYVLADGFGIGQCHSAQLCGIEYTLLESKVEARAIKAGISVPLLYIRVQDDILIIYDAGAENWAAYKEIFDKADTSGRRLEWEVSTKSVDWCDLTIHKGPRFLSGGALDLRLFIKPTDQGTQLQRSSHHPEGTFKSILVGEASRLLINNSSEANWRTSLARKAREFRSAGYSPTEIATHLLQARTFSQRPEALLKREVRRKRTKAEKQAAQQEGGKLIAYKLNYTPRETEMNMPGLIRELHEWATEQPRMGEHASNTRFVACHLRSTSIGNKAQPW